ncbi:type VI secretion system ATPase TssH [Limnohabitans sp.]|jgi:type VI secretion system protein VasG|uniref:type VI secretion system ATPase TssH n=1 Tax=Limnohabitans sp. TaxID=1907725 RepID=UPI0037BEA500
MNIPRRALFGKLNLSLFKAMESATAYAKLKNHSHIEICHWLWHFWQISNNDLHVIAAHYKLDGGQIEQELRNACECQPHSTHGLIDFGHQTMLATEKAWIQASLVFGDRKIRSAWLLVAMLSDTSLRLALRSVSPSLLKITPPLDKSDWAPLLKGSSEQTETAHDDNDLPSAMPGEASLAMAAPQEAGDALHRYCADLTEQARNGKLDAVIGREHEIRTMIDILLRRRQNNPLLTGEAGVGKTAVVEGLALAIAQRNAPPALHKVRLLSLDVGALLAGASMRGEFEARLKQLLKEAQDSETPVILFIDEVHTLVGAGGQAGTGDAANLLKPALARGSLRTIGATTWTEFKKHIEKDPALTRRFQVLQVQEPHIAAAKAMLRSLVDAFTQHHGVVIDNSAVEAAVDFSHRYIPARQLPDKAISLLDTACARVAMSQHSMPAALQRCQARMDEVQSHLKLRLQDQKRNPDHSTQIDELTAQLETLATEKSDLTTRWENEKTQVQNLQKAWSNDPAQGEGEAAPSTPPAYASDLQKQLQTQQGDDPLVHAQVNAAVVASVVADWTGIPIGKMLTSDLQAILQLEAALSQRVKGQTDALRAIAQRVQIAKSGLTDPQKPIGVFMLIGPSGVGKTETALALAETVYGGEHNLITLNMSEFQEPHTVSTIKGSPPGYVGYGEGGILTEAVRRKPHSVVLLDEIEKAHSDVHELFYQVFDKGWMEDGEGQRIDFRNTLILLTSNTGSELVMQLHEDPDLRPNAQALTDALQPALREVFPAAFLGRTSIVPYAPLSLDVIAEIVELQVKKVSARMQHQHQILLTFSDMARANIGQAAGALEIGGRRIAQHIERQVLPVLSTYWLEGMQQRNLAPHIVLTWSDTAGYTVEQARPKP